jgi:hypothetical protein
MQQARVPGGPTDDDMDIELHGTGSHLQVSVKEGDKLDLILTAPQLLDPGVSAGDTGDGADGGLSGGISLYQSTTGRPRLSRHRS